MGAPAGAAAPLDGDAALADDDGDGRASCEAAVAAVVPVEVVVGPSSVSLHLLGCCFRNDAAVDVAGIAAAVVAVVGEDPFVAADPPAEIEIVAACSDLFFFNSF